MRTRITTEAGTVIETASERRYVVARVKGVREDDAGNREVYDRPKAVIEYRTDVMARATKKRYDIGRSTCAVVDTEAGRVVVEAGI